MPSSGSTIQRMPLVPSTSPPSSPSTPSSGRAAAIRSRIRCSAAWSASETRSVGVLLARDPQLRAAEGVAQQRARLAGDRLGQRAQLAGRHAATAGRCAGQSRARSSWAESEIRRASESGGPTSCTPSGKPSAVKPAGTRHGGLAGVVERAAVGREARHADQRQQPGRPSYSRTRGGRRVNIGVSTTSACVEDPVEPLGVGRGLRRRRRRRPRTGSTCPIRASPRARRESRSRWPISTRLVADARARSARARGCPSSAPSRTRARRPRGRARAAARRSSSTAPRCSSSGCTPSGGSPIEIAIRSRPGSVAAASVSDGPPSLTASMKRRGVGDRAGERAEDGHARGAARPPARSGRGRAAA